MKANKLPSYLIIGEARCGTTSLYNMLIQHPNIAPATKKELYFFTSKNWNKKEVYYKKLGKCEEHQIIGEATPSYFWKADIVPQRIKQMIPNAKLILCLRNPVYKVYSHFMLGRSNSKLTLEEKRDLFIKEANKYIEGKKTIYYKLFDRAKYAIYLKEWLKYFPREQFYFVYFQELLLGSNIIVNDIFKFLKLSKWQIEPLYKHGKKYLSLPKKFIKKFANYYEPYNEQLCNLIGCFSQWENL